MALTEPQLQKVRDWMQSKQVSGICPSCSQSNWTAADIVSAPVITTKGITMGGPTVPMVQVICSNCAHVRLFAAVPMGLP